VPLDSLRRARSKSKLPETSVRRSPSELSLPMINPPTARAERMALAVSPTAGQVVRGSPQRGQQERSGAAAGMLRSTLSPVTMSSPSSACPDTPRPAMTDIRLPEVTSERACSLAASVVHSRPTRGSTPGCPPATASRDLPCGSGTRLSRGCSSRSPSRRNTARVVRRNSAKVTLRGPQGRFGLSEQIR
jgi:hypothetical protein